MKTFFIYNELLEETENAIKVRAQRSDGVWAPQYVYFPKSQCELVNKGFTYKVSIPTWLYDKKILPGWKIVTN